MDGSRKSAPRAPGPMASGLLLLCLSVLVLGCTVGCIQDEVVIPVANLQGRIIPVGITPTTITTVTTSVGSGTVTTTFVTTLVTINTTVSTIGVRLNTTGSGTNISLTNPIGPAPGTPEFTFCTVTGDWLLPTAELGRRRVVARGIEFDIGWGDFFPLAFNMTYTSNNLKSASIPANSPLRTNNQNNLRVKSSGQAVFLLFAEDFTIDRVPPRTVSLVLDNFVPLVVAGNVFAMEDDGSAIALADHPPDDRSADLAAGDGVFTRILTGIPPGQHFYGFIVNNDGQIRRDPYEESSDLDGAGVRRSRILVKE